MLKQLFFIFFLSALTFKVQGQKTIFLDFKTDDYNKVTKKIQNQFKDSLKLWTYLKELRSTALKKGFLLASIDSVYINKNNWLVDFYVGDCYKLVHLETDEQTLRFIKRHASLNEKYLQNIPFKASEIEKLMTSIHKSTLNNGYPFSKVYLEKIAYEGADLHAVLKVNKGDVYRFNNIVLKGDTAVSKKFISNYLNIKEGDLFDESKLQDISKKIKQLLYLKEIKNHELLFTNQGVDLFLYLQSNPINSFNGVLGLQPNIKTNRVQVIGELNLKLLNVFKKGEAAQLNWRSIQEQTQALNIKFNLPFLFNTPFGTDVNFQLYKRDTTFLELKTNLGVQYLIKGGGFLKVFYQNYTSNVLRGGILNNAFSNTSNVKTNSYGIQFNRRNLDYLPNPSRGFSIQTDVAIGSRLSSQPDSSNWQKSTVYKGGLFIESFFPISKRNVLKLASNTELYYADQIFRNELFRFGGQSSLRGFNEEELNANARTVVSIEYRYLLDQNSNIFVFYDQAIYENSSATYVKDLPFGIGAGLSFGTNFGIFSISYALGKQFDNPIEFRNSKVHFGYVAFF